MSSPNAEPHQLKMRPWLSADGSRGRRPKTPRKNASPNPSSREKPNLRSTNPNPEPPSTERNHPPSPTQQPTPSPLSSLPTPPSLMLGPPAEHEGMNPLTTTTLVPLSRAITRSTSSHRLRTPSPHSSLLSRLILRARQYATTGQHATSHGISTPLPEGHLQAHPSTSKFPFYFETGYSLFAKRASRPFPPPFMSLPSGSFSDPLTTHTRSRDRRSFDKNGEMIRGVTNGDDAVLVGENFIGANDGVGAWATREKGHAALATPLPYMKTSIVLT